MMGGIMAWADAITGYHPQSSAFAAVFRGADADQRVDWVVRDYNRRA